MMIFYKLAALVLGGVFLVACSTEHPGRPGEKSYFDVQGLLNQQANLLSQKSAGSLKVSLLNGEKDSIKIALDSAGWSKELEVFGNVDINGAALVGAYTTEDGLSDPKSNLQIIAYTALNLEKVAVSELKVYYLKKPEQVRRIQARYKDKNALYQHFNEVDLVFEEIEGAILLQSYRLNGQQKMILSDSLNYQVKGTVIF